MVRKKNHSPPLIMVILSLRVVLHPLLLGEHHLYLPCCQVILELLNGVDPYFFPPIVDLLDDIIRM
jgi:hypothetical protein